jgi:soluble lytic murein transglycosylase
VWWAAFVVALLSTSFALFGGSALLRAEDEPAPAAASPSTEAPDTLQFTLANLRLPADSPETRCVMALGRGVPEECQQIALAAMASAEPRSLGRLQYLYVRATADPALTRPVLETLSKENHPLAPWAQLRLAELLRDLDAQAALEAADALPSDRRWQGRAEALRAVALSRAGHWKEAEALLRKQIAQQPASSSAAPASMTLAAILANRPDARARKEALGLYRRVYSRSPLTATGEQAKKLALEVLASFPKAERASIGGLPYEDAQAEADALLAGRAYALALKAYQQLEARHRKQRERACEARLGQGRALMSMRKVPDAVNAFTKVITGCREAEPRANAHFQVARALLRQGNPLKAIEHYDSVVRLAPNHRLADDALLAASQAFIDLKDPAGARARLAQLLGHPREDDMRPNARFALAWLERSEGHLSAALAEFAQLIVEGTGETSEDLFGRARYWHARTLLDQGNREQAAAEFTELFRSWPLTYYSQQALARLGELDSSAAIRLLDELRDDGPHEPARFGVRPELKGPEFERAVELLRVGEPARATEELSALGMFERSAADELYMLGTALLQEFGAQTQATTLSRRRVGQVMKSAPKGNQRALWRVAFPRAYYPLIDEVARGAQVPAAFVRAVAREESSFDPTAVSHANAYGLIQLIPSTAKSYARPLGLPYDAGSLKTPEVNLRIGTSFMRDLFTRYASNPAIVPSAYNAGGGSSDRWLRERPTLALDEWIETIPYTETRRYTRRVLQSYGVYAWLDEQRLPPLSARLPTHGSAASAPDAAVSLREP